MYYFKLLQVFLGVACQSADTFLRNLLLDPSKIKENYIPFVQNIKVLYGFQSKLQTYDDIISMQCKFC
jgi:hypothetical protein